MASFSRDTFATHRIERLKHYVSVRLQQGVPLVDADWNEMDDIRKYELRTFLKWFVGDGIPQQNNDAFRIIATPAANDFIIKGGDGTWQGAARCLVDGWEVFLPSDLQYTAQALYNDPGLAAQWGVDPLLSLLEPGGPFGGGKLKLQRTDTVYLDVWERSVDSREDSTLNNEAIGIETSVRMKREWVVRVAVDASEPPAPTPGHAYYALARLDRRAGEKVIPTERITDLRRTGLTLMSQHDITQITKDAFGEAYPLDQTGTPQLKVSLRDAVNAALRGETPSTREIDVGMGSNSSWDALMDSQDDMWIVWNIAGGPGQRSIIKVNRLHNGDTAWNGGYQIFSSEANQTNSALHIMEDGQRNIWMFWQATDAGRTHIWYQRFIRANGSFLETAASVTTGPGEDSRLKVHGDHDGNIWLFWQAKIDNVQGIRYWCCKQDGTIEPGNIETPYDERDIRILNVTNDKDGDIWIFWKEQPKEVPEDEIQQYSILCRRFKRNSGVWDPVPFTVNRAGDGKEPVAMTIIVDQSGALWLFWATRSRANNNGEILFTTVNPGNLPSNPSVLPFTTFTSIDVDGLYAIDVNSRREILIFWNSDGDIWYQRLVLLGSSSQTLLTPETHAPAKLRAIQMSSQGDLYAFWTADNQIWFKRYSSGRGWSRATSLTTGPGYNDTPVVFEDSAGDLCVFWQWYATQGTTSNIQSIRHKKMLMSI